MIYAQITNNTIVNTINLDDASLLPLFNINPIYQQPYDMVLQIDHTYPQPGIGWMFDGIGFYYPSVLALIQNNTVVNIIQNYSSFDNISSNYQSVVDITTFDPQPKIGYAYNIDGSFTAPPVYPSQEYFQAIVAAATAFGVQIITQAAARNISMGITQAGQTIPVMEYCAPLITSLFTGSLYAAISQLNAMIADTSTAKTSLAPFITNSSLYLTLNQIQTYLGIPLTPNPGP